MTKIKVALLGATGIVGQAFLKMLSNHPFFEVEALCGSENSSSKNLLEATDWLLPSLPDEKVSQLKLELINEQSLISRNIRLLFSALPSAIAAETECRLRSAGFFIFSNASAFRYEEDIPILIPEINAEQIILVENQIKRYGGFILPGPNCSTSGLVFILKALERYKPETVFLTTMQSVSGAGRQAIPVMSISGNVIPFIKNEEEKIAIESQKILGCLNDFRINPASITVNAFCCRVNTSFGHLETVYLQTEKSLSTESIIEAIAEFNHKHSLPKLPSAPRVPIHLFNQPNRPQPLLDSWLENGMAVSVGRIKPNICGAGLILLVNNLIRGAAGNCLLNAELAYQKGLLKNWR